MRSKNLLLAGLSEDAVDKMKNNSNLQALEKFAIISMCVPDAFLNALPATLTELSIAYCHISLASFTALLSPSMTANVYVACITAQIIWPSAVHGFHLSNQMCLINIHILYVTIGQAVGSTLPQENN